MNQKNKRCLNTIMSSYKCIIVEGLFVCLMIIVLIKFRIEANYWKNVVNDKEKKVELIKNKLELNINLKQQLQNSILNLNETEISFKQAIINKNKYLENEFALAKYFKLKQKQTYKTNSKILSPKQEFQIEKQALHLINKQCYNNYNDIDLDSTLFHVLCDRYPSTLTIIKTKNGNIFGGYTSQSWEGSGEKRDANAFLFSIGINNDVQFYPIKPGYIAINCKSVLLPTFGIDDIFINPHSGCSISRDIRCYDGFKNECELNKGKCNCDIEYIEVFSMTNIN